MAALRIEKITIDEKAINELKQQGYLLILNRTLDDGLPIFQWEKPSASSCNNWIPVDSQLGIYYSKNWNHPAANEPTPSWWKKRFIQVNWQTADDYWELFRDRLVAAKYYVPVNVDMNKAIQAIANWAFSPNTPNHRGSGLSTVNVISLERYVGVNHWNNSLPSIVYRGLIPIFSYKVDNLIDTPNSEKSMLIDIETITASSIGYVSGLLVSGMFVSTQAASQINIDHFEDDHGTYDFTRYIYLKGKVYSPGDYIVTAWKVVGKTQCNGIKYKVIVPRTVTTPFYTVSLDFSHIYVYNNTKVNTIGFLKTPGISIVLSNYKYNQNNYIGNYHTMFKFEVKKTSASINYGYQAIIGNPVFYVVKAIFDYIATGPYEKLATKIMGLLLDTGYINVRYTGSGALISLKIKQSQVPPNETYIINVMNKVPRSLDHVNGVDTLTWGGLIIEIGTSQNPPPCGPSACPTNNSP